MSDDAHTCVCDSDGCPRARVALAPRSVAAVARAPRPGRAVAAVPWSGLAMAVPISVARWRQLPDPKGEQRRSPVRASGGIPGASRQTRGDNTPKAGEQATPPRRASSDGAARGTRFERHHGRREVRTATIARDILLSSAVWAARVTTSICSCVVDDVLRQLPHLLRVMSFDYCVLVLPQARFTLKTIRFYDWTRSSYISLLHAYFLHAHWKGNSLIYGVCNYHKNQIKSFMFVTTIFLHLP
jgi:hypothetical protein